MNSEELEQSLRAEFENYLKGVVVEMRQSVSDFQEKINADFEKQKELLETSFREFNEQIGKEKELELSFTDSVAEHLKLAKDEGARITATAIAEAEELQDDPEPLDFSELRNAINDISEKDSQSEILKALVNHATEFTPRGAFFIVKNEHLVGWRVFGQEEHDDPQVIREVFFPVDSNTALSAAVRQLSTVSEAGDDSEDDVMYRNRLGFDNSDNMCAIPLIARGRGVAVLYADTGSTGAPVNVSAIESLMRVAGLTVEVLASAPPATHEHDVSETVPAHDEPQNEEESAAEFEPVHELDEQDETPAFSAPEPKSEVDDFAAPGFAHVEEASIEDAPDFQESETFEFQPGVSPEAAEVETPETAEFEAPEAAEFEAPEADFETPVSDFAEAEVDTADLDDTSPSFEAEEWNQTVSSPEAETADTFGDDLEGATDSTSEFEAYDGAIHEPYVEPEAAEPSSEFDFDQTTEEPAFDEPVPASDDFGFDTTSDKATFDEADVSEFESGMSFDEAETDAADDVASFDSFEDVAAETPSDMAAEAPAEEAEAVPAETVAPSVRPRFADRNLDLPIEVGEDERRLHNDARRFARLLVSEIKLYNEQKVKEGRESNDLYERLREAIDRSREMYDKRVQPPVAAKFDYFNYELVNTLAEGDEGKLGGSYPGPAV